MPGYTVPLEIVAAESTVVAEVTAESRLLSALFLQVLPETREPGVGATTLLTRVPCTWNRSQAYIIANQAISDSTVMINFLSLCKVVIVFIYTFLDSIFIICRYAIYITSNDGDSNEIVTGWWSWAEEFLEVDYN